MDGYVSMTGHTKTYHRVVFLSPTLYSLYRAELKSKMNQNCKLLEYADDVAVYSVNRYSRIGVSELEKPYKVLEFN
jgi:hypothetical protein